MATISKEKAVQRLTKAVGEAQPDDLLEIYNELFPETPTTDDDAIDHPVELVDKIVKHIDNGLEVEEILDLWNVVFPLHRSVWFDEEDGVIHYEEKIEPVGRPE